MPYNHPRQKVAKVHAFVDIQLQCSIMTSISKNNNTIPNPQEPLVWPGNGDDIRDAFERGSSRLFTRKGEDLEIVCARTVAAGKKSRFSR